MTDPWVIGMVINLGGNILINIGTNCVKHDHARTKAMHESESLTSANSSVLSNADQLDGVPNAPKPSHLLPSFPSLLSRCTSPFTTCWYNFVRHGRWWYVGWSVYTVGNIVNFVSLSFTPQSLLAGLGSSQFLMNAVCEWYLNGVRITARMVKATVLIIIGNTLIVAFASHESPKLTVDELFQLMFKPAFDIYIVILLILTLILQIYYNETRKALRVYQAAVVAVLAAGGTVNLAGVGAESEHRAGSLSGSSSSHTGHSHSHILSGHDSHDGGSRGRSSSSAHEPHVLLPEIPPPPSATRLKLLPFSYAAVSAIIGTQSVLLAKATSDLIRTSVAGNQQFDQAFTWVLLVGWASTIVFWLYRLDTALRKFEGPFIVPVLQVVWTLFSIVGGGIYFQEFAEMGGLAIGLFIGGVCVMLFGVYLLAPQPTTHRSELDEHLAHADHLSDVELGGSGVHLREGSRLDSYGNDRDRDRPSDAGVLHTPPAQMHGLFLESAAQKDDKPLTLRNTGAAAASPVVGIGGGSPPHHAVLLNAPPPKITRVTSTGRMIIQSNVESRDVFVEVDGDFNPFDGGMNGLDADNGILAPSSRLPPTHETEHLTDDNARGGGADDKTMRVTVGLHDDRHARAMEKPGPAPRSVMGVLSEAGLLGTGRAHMHTPPLRPSIVQWSTPPRSAGDFSLSRPSSASGLMYDASHGGGGGGVVSIPPSPALVGYDLFGNQTGATKRARAVSLGFSMPMVDLDDQP